MDRAKAADLGEVRRHLHSFATSPKALGMQRFFKTGPGQYGEGDLFLGITIPEIRQVARAARGIPPEVAASLLDSEYHEERMLALMIMVDAFQRGDEGVRRLTYDLLRQRLDRINNWDLVDASAPYIVGPWLENRSRRQLHTWAKSSMLWERRIAIVATLHFIRSNDFAETLAISETLLGDRHDLIHKAVGWMLREVGKRDEATLEAFLEKNRLKMPRTALRYAIERMTPEKRRHYMAR
jgi:3-methyladenine DNA glycosylase AlkD